MIQPPNLSGNYATDMPAIKQFFENLFTGLSIDNFDAQDITTITSTAATDHVVTHKLGRIPTRFILTTQDKQAGVIMIVADEKTVTFQATVDDVTFTGSIQ